MCSQLTQIISLLRSSGLLWDPGFYKHWSLWDRRLEQQKPDRPIGSENFRDDTIPIVKTRRAQLAVPFAISIVLASMVTSAECWLPAAARCCLPAWRSLAPVWQQHPGPLCVPNG